VDVAEQAPVGIGMIGLGRWANAHGDAATRSDKVRIVNCFARTPETRSDYQQRYNVTADSKSIEELLSDPAVEGVVISTPNDLHVEHTLAAIAAGKRVLVDKPVAVDSVEGLRLLRAVDEAGVAVGVAHHPRRLAGTRAAKAWMDSGEAGRVRMAHADFSNNRSSHMKPDAWHRFARGSEAGVLIQVGIHQVENMLYLLGPAAQVNARFAHETLGPTMADLAAVTITHTSGAVSVVTSSWTTPGYFSIEVMATGGNYNFRLDHRKWTSGDVDDFGQAWLHPVDGEPGAHPTVKGDPLKEQLEELATGDMEVDVAAGLRATMVVEASVRSAASDGTPVDLTQLLRESGATEAEVARLV
jgi:predicted dehydrogenase